MTTPGAATQWLATFHLPPRSLRLHVQTCVHCRNRPAQFPAEREEETASTGATSSAKLDEKGNTMFSARLDEEEFEPLVEEEELPSIPTEEELIRYPELEYSSREVQAIVNKMDRA